MRFFESGFNLKWLKDYERRKYKVVDEDVDVVLIMGHVHVLFYVWVAGLFLGLVIFVLEVS